MKYLILTATLFLYSGLQGYAQANKIVGKWLKLPKEDLVIEVYLVGNRYNGKIEWSKNNSSQEGSLILQNLKFDEKDHHWEGGKIVDPRTGKKYDAFAELKPDGTLEVSGYKGFKFLGAKRSFKRIVR